jgi:hypothetical protein
MDAAYFIVLVAAMIAMAAGCLLLVRRLLSGAR